MDQSVTVAVNPVAPRTQPLKRKSKSERQDGQSDYDQRDPGVESGRYI